MNTLNPYPSLRALFLISLLQLALVAAIAAKEQPNVIPFADNGGLKMLYDNRQYPHAVTLGEKMHVVWRGEDGFPYCAYYDLQARSFSEPVLLVEGFEDEIDARKYRQDHHFAPVIWSDQDGYLHTLFGCHRTTGIHLVSKKPGDSTQWRRGIDFSESISYPKIHRIYDDKTLVYTRYSGHLDSGSIMFPMTVEIHGKATDALSSIWERSRRTGSTQRFRVRIIRLQSVRTVHGFMWLLFGKLKIHYTTNVMMHS